MLPNAASARFQDLLNSFELGDADSLKAKMRLARCIISGSVALALFHPPGSFIPGDLDFYVPASSATVIEDALRERGYTEVEGQDKMTFYGTHALATASRLQKLGVTPTINLMTTHCQNPIKAVLEYHSTLVMNVITSEGVLCLYPLLTLAGKGVIMVDTPAARLCFAKYRRRGFRLQTRFAPHDCNGSRYCRNAIRSIDDDQVLDIPFDPNSRKRVGSELGPFYWRLGRIKRKGQD